MIATILTAVALVASLGFNYLQYKWRKEQREEYEREKAEAKAEQLRKEAEQLRKERMPPEFYNLGGTPNPIRITGSQHSVKGPFVDAGSSGKETPCVLADPSSSAFLLSLCLAHITLPTNRKTRIRPEFFNSLIRFWAVRASKCFSVCPQNNSDPGHADFRSAESARPVRHFGGVFSGIYE